MLNRWWTYQQERFPVFKNGLLIAVFSWSAVCYSILLRGGLGDRSPAAAIGSALIALIVVFLFFVQLRIADEFKDYEDDFRYRPYRPVPRGLVTLRELGIVGIGAAAIQLGLTLALGWRLLLLLAIVWGYLGLMTKEFFAPNWLKSRPVVYMLSHMVIMPLMALYATGCDWLAAGASPQSGLGWFLAASFLNGMVIEIGRKIRAPKDEERGVETYSARWGVQTAVRAWLGVVWLSTLSAWLAAAHIQFSLFAYLLLLLLLTGVVFVAWRFYVKPTSAGSKRIELVSGVWTLGVYLTLGLLPLLLHGTS
jgi:UbiA prenyltransferase family